MCVSGLKPVLQEKVLKRSKKIWGALTIRKLIYADQIWPPSRKKYNQRPVLELGVNRLKNKIYQPTFLTSCQFHAVLRWSSLFDPPSCGYSGRSPPRGTRQRALVGAESRPGQPPPVTIRRQRAAQHW